ncbi:MAG: UDP-2,3-diacylglucosamine diphosphatase [Desulfuromonadaceae bacterium]
MRDIFLADAHLRHPQDANYRHLLTFLRSQRGELGTLYLLGDIFEFWIGYRHCVFAPYIPLLAQLRQLRQAGTRIVYVEGNHDFHLGPYFEQELQCRILPDGGPMELNGMRIHLSHGDLINDRDNGYLRLRRFLRSRFLLGLARLLPPDWAWQVAAWGSTLSRKKRPAKHDPASHRRLLENHARNHFQTGCHAVISAHYHLPLYQNMEEGKVLIALGDWISQYSYAVFEDGRFSLKTFSPEES